MVGITWNGAKSGMQESVGSIPSGGGCQMEVNWELAVEAGPK